jgi:hypothetical protein
LSLLISASQVSKITGLSHWRLLPFFFLNIILIVQVNFALVLQAHIYRALIKSTPPLLTFFLSPCSPKIQQLMVQYAISIYRWVISIFENICF